LKKFKDVPIGSYDYNQKFKLSPWYHNTFGDIPKTKSLNVDAATLMLKLCDQDTILYTGGPNKNLGNALKQGKLTLKAWYAQGGFAGVNVVPKEYVIDKFKGLITCPTSNFGCSFRETDLGLKCQEIPIKYLCSKNVCHSIIYDKELHELLDKSIKENRDKMSKKKYISKKMMYDVMDKGYISKGNCSKKIHDVLPVVAIRDLEVCKWIQVELFHKNSGKEWGSRFSDDSNVFISINYDKEKFRGYFVD